MLEKTIYYHDTDAIGIAYYGSYLRFLEEDRTRLFKSKGVSVKSLHEQGRFFVIKELKVKYRSPARFWGHYRMRIYYQQGYGGPYFFLAENI